MPPNSPPSPRPSHSNEIEHRLTVVETTQIERWRSNSQLQQDMTNKIDAQDRRLNLHEKAILAIGAVLQILLQDKYPKLAELIKQVLP